MILAWFVGMGCYMLSFFTTFLTIPFAGGNGEGDPSTAPIFLVGFLVPFIIFGAIFVGGALFIIYGLFGAFQTFQGKDFRYIIIGNRLANYLQKKS